MSEDITKKTIEVKGRYNNQNILIYTLSTCGWCKKTKKYLKKRDVSYRYLDVNKLPKKELAELLKFFEENYEERVTFPFLICDDKYVIGYRPEKYDEFINTEIV